MDELIDFLRNREVLLLLDNFEQLTDAGAPLVGQILDACPDVKLLVTSREPLNLAVEWRLDLEGLSYPPALPQAPDEDAARLAPPPLLNTCGGTANRRRPAATRRSCKRSCGIRFGAAFCPNRTTSQTGLYAFCQDCAPRAAILSPRGRDAVGHQAGRELVAGPCQWNASHQKWPTIWTLSAHGCAMSPARQRSLRVIIEYTWNLLEADEQQLFQSISVFRGGFMDGAVTAVLGNEYASRAPHLLAGLIDRSLLQVTFGATGMRYSMHELLRQFGNELLARDGAAEAAVRTRHSTHYLQFLCAQRDALMG